MKKLILLTLFSSGCVMNTIDQAVNSIPRHEFGEFNYNRAGNASSGSVTAKGARFEDGQHIVDELNIHHTNRFLGNISVSFKDLKRNAVSATSSTGN